MSIILIRAIILYTLIMFSLRLMGKRQLGELQPAELVVTILISNIAALPIESMSTPLFSGIIPVLTLVCIDVFVSGLMMKSNKFRRLVSGNPIIIISNGKLIQKEMRRLRYSIDDLLEAMHENQIFDLNEIQYAIVENNGAINFYQKYAYRNVQNRDLELKQSDTNPPAIIIRDGKIDQEGLLECHLGEGWLNSKLEEHKLKLKDVFMMSATQNGEISYLMKDKKENEKS